MPTNRPIDKQVRLEAARDQEHQAVLRRVQAAIKRAKKVLAEENDQAPAKAKP